MTRVAPTTTADRTRMPLRHAWTFVGAVVVLTFFSVFAVVAGLVAVLAHTRGVVSRDERRRG